MQISKNTYILLYGLLAIVYILGLLFPLMDPDANEYASIAMRMAQRNDFVNIISRSSITLQEYDYLDKPHLPFWLAAISYKIFGISDWAYRIPSLLFTILGAYSTFGLGSVLYNKNTGRNAALIFLTSQAIILGNHDVRMDAILTGAVIFGIWQLAVFVKNEKLINVALGMAGIALGVATKGMISVLVGGTAIFCHIIYLRKWHLLYSWKWLIGLLAFAVTIFPVVYCYYLQFDLHPEKIVNGAAGQSGFKFLFWSQSFERLAGNRAFVSNPQFSFLFHTLLWAILPWSLLAYISVFGRIKRFWKVRFSPVSGMEFLTLGCLLIIFNFISASRFKLPHYLNILFPLFAVLIASYIDNLARINNVKLLDLFKKMQYFVIAVLILAIAIINTWFFPVKQAWILFGALALALLLAYTIWQKQSATYKIIVPSVVAIVLVNFMLNANFYPQLLKYQMGNSVISMMKENHINKNDLFIYNRLAYSLDFYSQKTIPALTDQQLKEKKQSGKRFYIAVYGEFLPQFLANEVSYTKAFIAPQYFVSRLKLKFLNPATRIKNAGKIYLLQIN